MCLLGCKSTSRRDSGLDYFFRREATGKGAPSQVLFLWQLEILPWAILFDELPISLAFNMETGGRTYDGPRGNVISFLSPCVDLDVSPRLGFTVAWIISSVGWQPERGPPATYCFHTESPSWAILFDELPIKLAFNMETGGGRKYGDVCVLLRVGESSY
ncbi:hypothetical protein CEXT_800321 [Caerostris extrusa]|uniref:Uncharacterized protein n=1 Tax=Caerostris extrusa TaxID=172846 RepID=A0AAV4TBH3_CAEEX|nr:hypothetical protein CEXT_800321 [Caerostris extrusa]